MALIRRLIVQADDDIDPVELASARADLLLYAERMGVDVRGGFDVALPDSRNGHAFRDLMLARLRRVALASPPILTQHDCPHVPGFEEASWTRCDEPLYAFTATVI